MDDVAALVETIEQLGERDIAVLRVLNVVMNNASDWQDPFGRPLKRVHPNAFLQRQDDLNFEIAKALAGRRPPEPYNREEGYEVCARLQGFGLAHEIQVPPREVPFSPYCFRPSARGLLLLNLLGDNVQNLDKYAESPK